MLIPKRMAKLTIAGPKPVMEKVIRELHKRKVMHIVDHLKDEDIDIGQPLEASGRISEILVRIRSLSSQIKVKRDEGVSGFEVTKSISEIDMMVKELYLLVQEKLSKIKEIEEKLKVIKSRKETIEKIIDLPLPLELYTAYSSLSYFIGYVDNEEGLYDDLKNSTERCELHVVSGHKPLVALFIDAAKKDNAINILSKRSFSELNLSSVMGMKGMPQLNLEKVQKDEESLNDRKGIIESQLESIRKKWSYFLILSESLMSSELERLQAPLRFASTENTFIIRGWVPKNNADELQQHLNNITKDKLYVQIEDVKHDDKVPVELENPKGVKTFEFFMDLYTMPKYDETDPTFFIFLIFPLLFGFMLGDMGYGVITLIAAMLLKKKFSSMKQFFNVFIFSSITTIFFGALFGEIFGEEVIFGFELPHILSRAHQLDLLLGISIIVGIFHLLWGFGIGFVNVYRQHGLKHAIVEKFGWILLFPGLTKIILMLGLINGGPERFLISLLPNSYIIIGLAVIGVALIIMGEGVIGSVEIPSLFGNILSYGRLMAIGLASVQLALVTNEFAKEFFHAGGFMIIAAIVLLIVGHMINIALGWIGCFLHSLRLHYVEFFTKFFKGGAKRFQPFGIKA